jgi:hypothetical protein
MALQQVWAVAWNIRTAQNLEVPYLRNIEQRQDLIARQFMEQLE